MNGDMSHKLNIGEVV